MIEYIQRKKSRQRGQYKPDLLEVSLVEQRQVLAASLLLGS